MKTTLNEDIKNNPTKDQGNKTNGGLTRKGQGKQQWRNDQGSSNQGNWSNHNNNFSNPSSNPYVPPKGQYSNSPYWKESSSSESMLENMVSSIIATTIV